MSRSALSPFEGAFAERTCIVVAELQLYLFAIVLDGLATEAEITRDVSSAATPADQPKYVKLAISEC